MHILFSTIGDDGSRQVASDAASFVRVFWNPLPKTSCVEICSHKSSINLLQSIFHDIKNLHEEMHIFFSTIGDDGSRQCPSESPIFVRVFWISLPKTTCVEHFSHKSSINSLQYIFPVIKNLHKKTLCFFSTIGDDGSRQCRWVSPIFVRILRIRMYNSRLVEHFSHKSSILFTPIFFFLWFEIPIEIHYQKQQVSKICRINPQLL